MPMRNDETHRRAPERIEFSIVLLGVIGAVAALFLTSWRDSLGMVIGGAAAWLNFRWLRTSVVGLTNKIAANPQTGAPTALLAIRFVLRYAVLGVVVYATLKGSVASILGVFAGLLLIVPALFIEAVYEFSLSRQHST
jgi:hypothetical protein